MRSKQILVVLTLLCVMTLPAMALSESAVIDIGDGSGIVTIPITVTNAENVGSMDLTLRYDPAIVNVTSVANGDMGSTVTNLENTADGWVRIVAYQTGDGLNGAFILANVSFEPVGSSGSCPLEISVTTFDEATPAGNAMPYTVRNGTYTISYDAPSPKSNKEGTYPPVPDDDGDSGKNVTEENASVNTTIIETPTPSPVKNLPGDKTEDDEPGGADPTNSILVALALLALFMIGYLLYRKSQNGE